MGKRKLPPRPAMAVAGLTCSFHFNGQQKSVTWFEHGIRDSFNVQGDLLDDANVEDQVRARPKFKALLAARAEAAADDAEPLPDDAGANLLPIRTLPRPRIVHHLALSAQVPRALLTLGPALALVSSKVWPI